MHPPAHRVPLELRHQVQEVIEGAPAGPSQGVAGGSRCRHHTKRRAAWLPTATERLPPKGCRVQRSDPGRRAELLRGVGQRDVRRDAVGPAEDGERPRSYRSRSPSSRRAAPPWRRCPRAAGSRGAADRCSPRGPRGARPRRRARAPAPRARAPSHAADRSPAARRRAGSCRRRARRPRRRSTPRRRRCRRRAAAPRRDRAPTTRRCWRAARPGAPARRGTRSSAPG